MQSGVLALYLAMYFKIYCTLLFPLLTKNIVFWNQVILFDSVLFRIYRLYACLVYFFLFVSSLQSLTGRECLWSDQAGAEVVLIRFLQEAQGKLRSLQSSLYSSVITLAVLYDKPNYKMHIRSVPVRDYSDICF